MIRGTTNSEVRELTKLTLRSSEPEDGASSAPPESPTRREIPIHLRLEPPDYEKELHRRLVSPNIWSLEIAGAGAGGGVGAGAGSRLCQTAGC